MLPVKHVPAAHVGAGVGAGHAAILGWEQVTAAIGCSRGPGLVPAPLSGGTWLPEGAHFGSKHCGCHGSLPQRLSRCFQ